jgi:hypothetical protein
MVILLSENEDLNPVQIPVSSMEFYSATKKNEILSFTGKWVELENIILREVIQAQRPKAACSLSQVEYRPNQMQQYYETLVTLRGGHTREEHEN